MTDQINKDLPPLPEAINTTSSGKGSWGMRTYGLLFTAKQMRAYARAALSASAPAEDQNPIKTESRASACDAQDGDNAIKKASAPAAGSVPSDVDKKRIAHNAHVQCSLIPGATFYNAAEAAIDALLAQYGSPVHGVSPEVAETLRGIVNADWTQWGELACPEEFVRWAKARAAHVLSLLSAPQEGK